MTRAAGLISAPLLAGCAPTVEVISTDTNLMRVGSRPEGYPRMLIRRVDGGCVQVLEDWRRSALHGQSIWVKTSSEASVTCPG